LSSLSQFTQPSSLPKVFAKPPMFAATQVAKTTPGQRKENDKELEQHQHRNVSGSKSNKSSKPKKKHTKVARTKSKKSAKSKAPTIKLPRGDATIFSTKNWRAA